MTPDEQINKLEEWLTCFKKELENILKNRYIPFYKKKFEEQINELRKIKLYLQEFDHKKYGKIIDQITSLSSLSIQKKEENSKFEKYTNALNLEIVKLKIKEDVKHNNDFIERIYDANSSYDFYNDIKQILTKAKREVIIIDPFLDKSLIEVYFPEIERTLTIKILTDCNRMHDHELFKIIQSQYLKLEIKTTDSFHDRIIFCDGDAWVMGQSINACAKKKPTYLIKIKDSKKLFTIYDRIWNNSKKIE
jgi:hypothetical protein